MAQQRSSLGDWLADVSAPPLVLDGGLATALEAKGFDLDDPLWSARLLIEAPDAIRAVHEDYLRAGADCITTASYQGSLQGFIARGCSLGEARELLQRAVRLAVQARDTFWASAPHRYERRRQPLVAASIGPYGAYLADGSEYTGAYALDEEALYAFHRERWRLLAASEADLLACETIPSGDEVSALLSLIRETPERQAWLSVSCGSPDALWDGTPIVDVARLCEAVPNVVAVGVNCVKPALVPALLEGLRQGTTKALIAYPNAGEDYDAATRRWLPQRDAIAVASAAGKWAAGGARLLGGCCRVGPEQIRALRAALDT